MRGEPRLRMLLLVSAIVFAISITTVPAETSTPGTDEDSGEQYGDAAFEVVIYDSPHHRGRSEKYVLEENMRQNLVAFVGWGMNDRISSIRVGYRVGVILFYHRDFRGKAKICFDTTGMLEQEFNDEASSMIIFDRDFGEPMGVLLGQGPVSEDSLLRGFYPEPSRFYPLSESLEEVEMRIDFLEDFNDQAEWAFIARGVGSRYREFDVEAILFEHDKFRGNSLSLPPYPREARSFFLLDDFGFNRQASSLIVLERSARARY